MTVRHVVRGKDLFEVPGWPALITPVEDGLEARPIMLVAGDGEKDMEIMLRNMDGSFETIKVGRDDFVSYVDYVEEEENA